MAPPIGSTFLYSQTDRVIVGRLIPAGTGMPQYRDIYMEKEEPAPPPRSRSYCGPRMRRHSAWRILRTSSKLLSFAVQHLGGREAARSISGDTIASVGRTLTTDEILRLPVEERLELIAAIWDSIPADQLPVPESHRRALDEALSEHARDREAGQSWQEVRDELFPKR